MVASNEFLSTCFSDDLIFHVCQSRTDVLVDNSHSSGLQWQCQIPYCGGVSTQETDPTILTDKGNLAKYPP